MPTMAESSPTAAPAASTLSPRPDLARRRPRRPTVWLPDDPPSFGDLSGILVACLPIPHCSQRYGLCVSVLPGRGHQRFGAREISIVSPCPPPTPTCFVTS